MDVLIFGQRPLTEPIVFFALKTDPTDPVQPTRLVERGEM